jgi:hypothetical protein
MRQRAGAAVRKGRAGGPELRDASAEAVITPVKSQPLEGSVLAAGVDAVVGPADRM